MAHACHSASISPSLPPGSQAQVLPNHDEATFARVELPSPGGWDGGCDHGDTRAYYNRVFLPAFAAYTPAELFGWAGQLGRCWSRRGRGAGVRGVICHWRARPARQLSSSGMPLSLACHPCVACQRVRLLELLSC